MKAPLSPAQERLWLLQRLQPDDAAYTMYLVRALRGPLDPAALAKALSGAAQRHESLRTGFTELEGTPWAVIGSPVPVEWLRAGSREEAALLVEERINAAFDLAAGVPVRIAVIRIAADDHVLCLTTHHIVADARSLEILLEDLAELYTAAALGREPDLVPLSVQPSDYARWQRRRAERAVPHWLERLKDPPVPELPFGGPRTGPRRGAFHRVRLAPAVTRGIERLARLSRGTTFMVLMAAHQVLLHRHTGQSDLLVGTAVAGRDRVELEPLVGYLAQSVVLRGDLGGDPSFAELLDRTRSESLAALDRPGVPFERFDHPASTLLPTMLILHARDPGLAGPFGGLSVTSFETRYRQAKVDLLTEAWWEADELVVSLCYDEGLFAPESARRLAERYARLLESAAARPDTPISMLPIWTEADEAEVDGTSVEGAVGEVLAPELIAEAVRRAPEAIALVCGQETVTYGELAARADTLAAALRAAGVSGGGVVGVCLPRSVEAMVALLAVWRAGAAYLPLDPADPDERRLLALATGGATHVIASGAYPQEVTVIDPGAVSRDLAGPPTTRPADLAYVISTSGSAGRPKAVQVEHRALAARVRWMREAYGLAEEDRVVQFASLSFDAHVEEIFPALASGATLVLLPGGAVTLPDLLAGPTGGRVTVLDLPTAYWHHLVEDLDEIAWPPGLRLVILGGEQVGAAAVGRWRERFGDRVRLLNTYGPTETTVIATAAELTTTPVPGHPPAGSPPVEERGRPPIGRPIGATWVRVLDAHGRPVPRGVMGELVVGGAGVARGYAGLPELTADRFAPDPEGGPGARRYLTGDRARWRADGQLEFLGRLDGQLKVRGVRIEPGEIETRLLAHPGVRQAHVAARGDDLVAYVTGAADMGELRDHLARTLPRGLVPTLWVRLDALPLTTGGKVDRAALPEPPPAVSAARTAPRSEAEHLVAGIWSELLGVEEVGVFDDFFAVGGHSLMATRVAARLRAATGVEVPIRTVFARTTVAQLADAVEELLIGSMEEAR